MTTSDYPDVLSEDPKDLAVVLREIVRRRPDDIGDHINLENRFVAGRKVNKIPTDRNDVSANDRAGDINYDEDYFYIAVEISPGVLQWARGVLSTADPWDNSLELATETTIGGVYKSTLAQLRSGTANYWPDSLVVKAYIDERKAEFTSADQTITSAGLLTLPHGLSATPSWTKVLLKNATAQANWSPGDIVDPALFPIGTGTAALNRGCAVWYDATNVYVRYGQDANVFDMLDKNTGVRTAATNGSWRLVVKAFA